MSIYINSYTITQKINRGGQKEINWGVLANRLS